jgi:hypothetical protein
MRVNVKRFLYAPVMNAAFSDTRKDTTFAMSAGDPVLPKAAAFPSLFAESECESADVEMLRRTELYHAF